MHRLIWAIPTWLIFLTFRTFMILLGWIVVPIAAICGAYRWEWDEEKEKKNEFAMVFHFTWPWMKPWDNDEDGIANQMYWKAPNMFLQILFWSCWRNPANNLRYVPHLSVIIDPEKVGFVASQPIEFFIKHKHDDSNPYWWFCWCGPYSGIRFNFKIGKVMKRFWLGWKIYPTDKIATDFGHRTNGAGFATQFKTSWESKK